MKILKASAGSGKTYRLSKTYTELLLSDKEHRYPYRHILAVTFTNKATAEMKGRILRDLYNLSASDKRAKELLIDMLHDYSAFSVSTIDRFFQHILKAFAREIGQFADYQIELDDESLSREAMDRVLDSLGSSDGALFDWLKKSLSDSMEQGEKFNLEKSLYDMGKQLRSEEFRSALKSSGGNFEELFSKKRLAEVKQICIEKIKSYRDAMRSFDFPGKNFLSAHPEAADYIDKHRREYVTACLIYENLCGLGVAREFLKEFENELHEKNEMCLDVSNEILRDIVNDSDAPFVYEKTGTRYDHFLLDEFQDTSEIQWDNFLPLLKESESRGGRNLLVGDVKQSIYRFRGSDWSLLAERVAQEFQGAEEEALTGNWRSTENVVHFNNAFFTFASEKLHLENVYSDVRQTPCAHEKGKGFVRVSFCDKKDELEKVYESIMQARDAGAMWGDIAVLVRKNYEGGMVADMLVSHNIPVISEGTLDVKSSVVVRHLVSLLCNMDNPDDKVGGYLAKEVNLTYPSEYHSLVDLCESLLRSLEEYERETFQAEKPYIHTFLDDVLQWSVQNGNNLRRYLEHWETMKSLTIGSPSDGGSLCVMTIHKAKGLEFPYVIFPFAEKVIAEKHCDDTRWCRLDAKKMHVDPVLDGVYPIHLIKEAQNSAFEEIFRNECRLRVVDGINVFYVALTRASKALHIISENSSKKFMDGLKKGTHEQTYNLLSDVLCEYVKGESEFSIGEMYDFSSMERGGKTRNEVFEEICPSIALGGRLRASCDAEEFFSDTLGRSEFSLSDRVGGTVLHEILSRVNGPDDVQSSVKRAVEDGSLPREVEKEVAKLLSSGIASHPEWFPCEGRRIDKERSLFSPDGKEYRPDRVVFGEDGRVAIVDFKFGKKEETSYRRQVGRYASLYSSAGYEVSSAAIWYVMENKCDYIECE